MDWNRTKTIGTTKAMKIDVLNRNSIVIRVVLPSMQLNAKQTIRAAKAIHVLTVEQVAIRLRFSDNLAVTDNNGIRSVNINANV
jgi:hypothetical protein